MPRSVRLQYPGAFYHVMARANRREPIFRDDDDRHFFLQTLAEACGKTGWRIHAWVLIGTITTSCSKHPSPTSSTACSGFKTPTQMDLTLLPLDRIPRLLLRVICVVIAFGCASAAEAPTLSELLKDVTNSDVEFHIGFAGAMPMAKKSTPTAHWLELYAATRDPLARRRIINDLRAALKDEERWVVAHVILGSISSESMILNDDSWMGLKLVECTDKTLVPAPGQRQQIARFCEEKLRKR